MTQTQTANKTGRHTRGRRNNVARGNRRRNIYLYFGTWDDFIISNKKLAYELAGTFKSVSDAENTANRLSRPDRYNAWITWNRDIVNESSYTINGDDLEMFTEEFKEVTA